MGIKRESSPPWWAWLLILAAAGPSVAASIAIDSLTLEEKASLVTGQSAWETRTIPRLELPSVWMADGPVGLRKSTGVEVRDSLPATCFPAAAAMAATWSPDLIERVGAAIGAEARAQGVSLLLAPGLNVKRHPLGGRNFEYYSEDPLLSGRIAAGFVRGVQSQGVGATLKHFAANNQEYRRMLIDAEVDERTLREIYLRGFQIAVAEGRPQAVMTAYNRVNGVAASESYWLLTQVLREEWGFNGLVVSDWGAVDDPVTAVAAGLDLEMPGNVATPERIVSAVREGRLDEATLDRAVTKVLQLVELHERLDREVGEGMLRKHHDLARQVAVESMVLLQNDGLLPIDGSRPRAVGVVGRFAFEPPIQGIGSSQINPTQVDMPWTALQQIGEGLGHRVEAWRSSYAAENLEPDSVVDLDLFVARQDVVIVFAGQTAGDYAEAWDRSSMDLATADRLIVETVARSGRPFVVVLVGGGALGLQGLQEHASALVMAWLGGQAFGPAVADVLFGIESPTGKLPETFAATVADYPSAINFPGGPAVVRYGEGLYVGYRYFQSFDRPVVFPFGHGLTYTSFELDRFEAPGRIETLDEPVKVSLRVLNSGQRAGMETVQVYSRQLDPSLVHPDRELVAFQKIGLESGESRVIEIPIDVDRFAYFHDGFGQWVIEPGRYELLIGTSVTDIRGIVPLELVAGTMPRSVLTLTSTVGEVYANPRGRVFIDRLLDAAGRPSLAEAEEHDFFAAILRNLPMHKLSNYAQGQLPTAALEQILTLINSDLTPEAFAQILAQQSSQE